MESLTYSPFLYRASLRARSQAPVRHSPSKPSYKYYGRPQDTFEDLQASVKTQFQQLETSMKLYLTEVEDRVDTVNATTGRVRTNSKSPNKIADEKRTKTAFFPEIVKSATARNRSTSEDPKPLRLQPSKALHSAIAKRPQKDSLSNLLSASNGFEEDFEHIESVVEKLKADRSELPAPCLEDLLVEVLTRHQLHAAYKQAIWPSTEGTADPLVVFSKACDELKVTPVPALAKITGAKLVLNRYQLQAGLCQALGRTLPILSNLRIVHLDANAISDVGGYALLMGVLQHGKIASFYYTRNEVGLKVVEALKMMRNGEINDLSLRGCKVNLRALGPLIAAVLQLRDVVKLCIAEIGLSDGAIRELVAGLRRSRVVNLDIAWNQISLNATKAFLTYLRKDKKLQYLDYSWNSLASSDNEVAYLLGAILRNHPSLIHLNIASTQLNDQAVVLLVQGLKKSNTMVSLHLTDNQIEQRTVEFLKRHLDARTETQLMSHSSECRQVPLLALNRSFPALAGRKNDTSVMNIKVRDCYGNQVVAHRDNLVNIFRSDEHRGTATGESQILTRLLGHPEVLSSEQWVYSAHCWVCERWPIFTFTVKESALKVVESVDILTCRGSTDSKVTLKGSFNNWQDVPLQNTIGEEHAVSLLLPPGMHKFWLILQNMFVCTAANFRTREEVAIKINQVLVPIRIVDLQLLEATKTEKIRSFDKDKSVFKAFIDDSDSVVAAMFANDMKFSKISRVVKSESDFDEVMSVLKQNFREIKAIFDQTSAISHYPSISWLHFADLCTMCQVIDKKFLNTAAIDRLFIAVNVELVEQDDNPDRELCRFEFFEIIVRMAVCKYQDLALTPAEAVRKLLNEHILKHGTASNALQFRHDKLYHVDVNDILEVNLFNLQTMFAKYKDRRGKSVNIDGIKKLLDRAGVLYSDKDLMRDFVFSKMSILDESTANGAHEKMVFVEFLEFVGRFSESVIVEELPLHVKIERVLDAMFPPHGLKRKPVSDLEDEDGY